MGGLIVTNPDGRDHALPRLSTENVDVMPGTPLAVIGLWVEALRYRFNETPAEPLPWVWSETLRPDEDEAGTPLEPDPTDPHKTIGSPRKLLIESAYNIEKAARNYRPALYVDRGEVHPIKQAVNNFVGEYLNTQIVAYHCLSNMPIIIECESESSGESSTLGDLVWSFVLTTRNIFRKSFGFKEITEPVLGRTTPSTTDKTIWVTPVQFDVQYDVRWATKPIAPFLRDISLRLSKGTNSNELLVNVAANDLYLRVDT